MYKFSITVLIVLAFKFKHEMIVMIIAMST